MTTRHLGLSSGSGLVVSLWLLFPLLGAAERSQSNIFLCYCKKTKKNRTNHSDYAEFIWGVNYCPQVSECLHTHTQMCSLTNKEAH